MFNWVIKTAFELVMSIIGGGTPYDSGLGQK